MSTSICGGCGVCALCLAPQPIAVPPMAPAPMPVHEITVGDFRNWLQTFSDDAIIAVLSERGYTAPCFTLQRGMRSIVSGHYHADESGGLYFVIIRPQGDSV